MGFGGLNPMEATATLLILSKIAYMSKVSYVKKMLKVPNTI